MSQSMRQEKPAKWIQALTVAAVSVVVIEIPLFLLSQVDPSSPWIFFPSLILELPGIYLHT